MATRNRRVGVIGTVGHHRVRCLQQSGPCARRRRHGLLGGDASASSRSSRRGCGSTHGPVEGLLADSADVFVRPSFHQIARDYLDPLKRSGIDTLVLGCTHYPAALGARSSRWSARGSRLISSAEETAREVAETLARRGHARRRRRAPRSTSSRPPATPASSSGSGSRVFGRPLERVETVSLADLSRSAESRCAGAYGTTRRRGGVMRLTVLGQFGELRGSGAGVRRTLPRGGRRAGAVRLRQRRARQPRQRRGPLGARRRVRHPQPPRPLRRHVLRCTRRCATRPTARGHRCRSTCLRDSSSG